MTCQPILTLYEGKCVRGRDTKIVFCGTCGYAHVYPRPSAEEMAEYYKGAYYQAEKPAYSADQDRLGEYLDVVNQEKLAALGEARAFHRVAVDVGCGRETRWMKVLANAGYKCQGIDPCLAESQLLDNLFLVQPDWKTYAGVGLWEPVDVVSLNFVLEHVLDPRAVLAECREYMPSDSRLLIEVPNDFNPDQMLICLREAVPCWNDRQVPWWVSTPDHINYWTPGSLENLLRSCGFRVEVMRSTWPVERLILEGFDYRVDPEAKKLAVSCRAERQREWWALGKSARCVGRTVWCVARKEA